MKILKSKFEAFNSKFTVLVIIVIDQNPQRISQKEAFLKVPKSEIPYPKLTRVVLFSCYFSVAVTTVRIITASKTLKPFSLIL